MIRYLILLSVLFITSYAQDESKIQIVFPYSTVALPDSPLVYYPSTGLKFNTSDVKVFSDSEMRTEAPSNEYRVIATKVFKPRKGKEDNNGYGLPWACQAKIEFYKPGSEYFIKLDAKNSRDCNNPTSVNTTNNIMIGSNLIRVKVEYPEMLVPSNSNSLKWTVGVDKEVSQNFYFKHLDVDSFYEYDVIIKKGDDIDTDLSVYNQGGSTVDFTKYLDFKYSETKNFIRIKYGMEKEKKPIEYLEKNSGASSSNEDVKIAEFPFVIDFPKDLKFDFGDWCDMCPGTLPQINTNNIDKKNLTLKVSYLTTGINMAPEFYDFQISSNVGTRLQFTSMKTLDKVYKVRQLVFNDSFKNEDVDIIITYQLTSNSPVLKKVFRAKLLTN